MKKLILMVGITLTCLETITAQEPVAKDTTANNHSDAVLSDSIPLNGTKPAPTTVKLRNGSDTRFHTSAAGLIVPSAMIAYGFIALNNPSLKNLNHSTKSEILEDHPRFNSGVDNIMQYTPTAAVYILNAAGIHGAHNFRDRTIILGIAAVLTAGTTRILKTSTAEERPDGSNNLSFPSGHTSNAFMGAEFLYQEYKDVSPWIGIAGYAMATATGAMRMYNNRHWLSDVVAGAGIGILGTKAAYWIYPFVQRKLFPGKKDMVVLPYYNAEWKSMGLSLSLTRF